jgi:transposase
MGQAIAVRTDYTAGEVRRLATRAKDAAQARRLLAIAAVLEGASREDAAEIAGMDRQTLRDWVIRFNERGPDGLINSPSPGVPPKLDATHKAFLARIVEEGPIPAVHGVVRWRACDLIMRLHEEFGFSVSDDTIYRALKDRRNAEPVPPSCCPPATPRPCSFISTRSPPRSPPAPTPFSSSIKPDGMARKA